MENNLDVFIKYDNIYFTRFINVREFIQNCSTTSVVPNAQSTLKLNMSFYSKSKKTWTVQW